ncbi:MAG TPA: hypothetical protein VHA71_09000 [Rhodanobacteraceae bacterium]|jgi:hypothetical protein|nr:hypothetical protein [Rhodanobacteraceae bacterium]
MLTTAIHTSDIPQLFTEFAQEIEEEYWLRQVSNCEAAIRGNPLLKEYLQNEYELAYQLSHMSDLARRHGRIPLATRNDRTIYPAVGFIAQALSAIRELAPAEADQVRGRVRGAFKNPDDMRALRLELVTATHFIRSGKKVSWPEITGTGRFDLMVEGLGMGALEVECKSISNDKGRKIHRREILDFYALVKPIVTPAVAQLSGGLFVALTLPDRVPNTYDARVNLAKCCCKAIFGHAGQTLPDGIDLRIGEFRPTEIGASANAMDEAGSRIAIDRITGTRNREIMVLRTAADGVFVLVVQSKKDDTFLGAMFKSLGAAARDQLSGRRSALLVAGLDGVDGTNLRSIAMQENDPSKPPTAIRIEVSRFLKSDARNHLIGVTFFGGSSIAPEERGVTSTGGISYFFARRDSPFWHEDFDRMFNFQ